MDGRLDRWSAFVLQGEFGRFCTSTVKLAKSKGGCVQGIKTSNSLAGGASLTCGRQLHLVRMVIEQFEPYLKMSFFNSDCRKVLFVQINFAHREANRSVNRLTETGSQNFLVWRDDVLLPRIPSGTLWGHP